MRTINVYILLFLLLATGCEQDAKVQPKKYPFVIMKEINTNKNGAEFIAEVQHLGNSSILTYGFIWSSNPDFQYSYSYSNIIEHEITIGDYSLKVTSDLRKDVTYNVRPFIQTEDYLVYGNSLSFISEGSSLPGISYFEPKNGNYGDTIVIYGENFSILKSRVSVSLGTDIANVISTDFNEIKFVVPQKLSISGEVPLYVKSGEDLMQSDELFSIDGHRITDFNPKEGIIGETEVEITGAGFDPIKIVVWFGENKAQILDASETKIKVKLPFSMETGSKLIKVDIEGKMAITDNTFQIKSRWMRLKDFPGEPRVWGSLTIIDNYCYLLNGTQDHAYWNGGLKDFWRYNLLTDQWVKLQDFPGIKRSRGVIFAINGNIYYGFGQSGFNIMVDFWKFNIQTNTWTQLKNFPGEGQSDVIYFTLNNKGYVLDGNYQEGSTYVWQYEPDLDNWTLLGKIVGMYMLDARDAFFQDNDKAYIIPITFVIPGRHILHEFVPEISNFIVSKMVTIPESIAGDRLPTFILNGQLYILDYLERFWKYDFTTEKWTRLEDFPGGIHLYFNYFSKGGMGYVLFGSPLGYSFASPDIWLYNPDKSKY